MLPRLQVVTHGEAGLLIGASGVTCIVSIGDPGEAPPVGYEGVTQRLRLELVDAEHESAGRVATLEDIRRLIAFAPTIGASAGTVVIHCRAAISRSPAAACIVFAALLGPGRESEAVQALFELKPFAQPNRLMVRLADELLGREGRLVAAVAKHRP